jgi:hypothetical protein
MCHTWSKQLENEGVGQLYRCFPFLARLFEEEKVELLSSLRRQRQLLGRLCFRLSFLSRVDFSKTIKGIHLKLGILVHYQKRNQLQQGR